MTATTAILMIDVQKMYLEREQHKRDVFGWPPIWRLGEVVQECRQLLAAGRAAGMPVIYTRAVQRPDGADATPRMRRLLASVAGNGGNGRVSVIRGIRSGHEQRSGNERSSLAQAASSPPRPACPACGHLRRGFSRLRRLLPGRG